MKIKRAILPVAGFGTRILPATKAQPKEMLPVVDKPVIQYLVEEAVASGIEEIIFVTGRGKRAIEDHFDHSFELEYNLVEKGKHDLLKEVERISELAKFSYVRQRSPRGDGDAVLQAKHLIGNEPCAVMFGDDLVDAEEPALKQLINVFNNIGLDKEIRKYAAKALGSFGDPEAIYHLIKALRNDFNQSVRRASAFALKNIYMSGIPAKDKQAILSVRGTMSQPHEDRVSSDCGGHTDTGIGVYL